MRVNIEDTIWEHIPRLAKELRWDEDRALGKLARVYRVTQKAEVYEESPSRLVTVCALHFDSDQEAESFFTAMIAAQLASLLVDGRIRIKGNLEHIERLKTYRNRAQQGGIARSKKTNDLLASKQATGSHKASTPPSSSEPSYAPMLLTPNNEEEILDQQSAKPKRERKPRTPSAPAASPTGFGDVVAAWFAAYERRYHRKPKWGPRQGAQLKQLMVTYSAEELAHHERGLIRHFFAWQRPEVIKGGHSFGKGAACFTLKIEELEADIAAPERRREAATAQKLEHDADRNTQQQDQAARVAAQIIGAMHAGHKALNFPAADRGPHGANHAPVRDVQPSLIGSGDEDMG